MRARITAAVVAILALALTIAGIVSAVLVRQAARNNAVATVLRQTTALVASVRSSSRLETLIEKQGYSAQVLDLVQSITGASAGLVIVGPHGELIGGSAAPPTADQRRQLSDGLSISGLSGSVAYAAAPLVTIPAVTTGGLTGASGTGTGSGAETVAIVLSEPVSTPGGSVSFFVFAAGVALVVAATVAALIARRISRDVVAASAAAEAIAAGDLEVRIEGRGPTYPELAALGAAINTMAEGLSRARALERQFLLSISHDLRTPLTSIRGYAEAIADGAVPDVGSAAEVVVAEAARLERLIRDLLDLAYLDAHQFSLHLGAVDLGAAVSAAAEALRFELETATVTLEVRPPPEPLLVTADGDRLAQIIANLVENAGKYARSRVVVSVAPEAGEARRRRDGEAAVERAVAVAVEDDGPGIAAEDLPHIFERLYTSERRPSRAARGTGLGLAIVAELTEAMGGSVRAESPVGPEGGTRMVVRLPLHEPPVPASSPVPA